MGAGFAKTEMHALIAASSRKTERRVLAKSLKGHIRLITKEKEMRIVFETVVCPACGHKNQPKQTSLGTFAPWECERCQGALFKIVRSSKDTLIRMCDK